MAMTSVRMPDDVMTMRFSPSALWEQERHRRFIADNNPKVAKRIARLQRT